VTTFQNISKGKKKYSLNLLVNLLPFWPTYALPQTGHVSLSNPPARYLLLLWVYCCSALRWHSTELFVLKSILK